MRNKFIFTFIFTFICTQIVWGQNANTLGTIFANLENANIKDSLSLSLRYFLYKYRIRPTGFTALENYKALRINDSIYAGKIYIEDIDERSKKIQKDAIFFLYNEGRKEFHYLVSYYLSETGEDGSKIEENLEGIIIINEDGFSEYSFSSDYIALGNYTLRHYFTKDNIYYEQYIDFFTSAPPEGMKYIKISKRLSHNSIQEYFELINKFKKEAHKSLPTIIDHTTYTLFLPKR